MERLFECVDCGAALSASGVSEHKCPDPAVGSIGGHVASFNQLRYCPVHQPHDEAMRMQALMFGAYMVGGDARERDWMCAQEWAAKAYREATGREW